MIDNPRRLPTVLGAIVAMASVGLPLQGRNQGAGPAPEARARSPVVISEVLFDPRPGDSPFVELLNTGSAPVNVSRMALRADGSVVLLARVSTPLVSGGRLLIRFDGQGRTDGLVHHAPGAATLDAASGAIDLRDEFDERVDFVAWGDADGSVDRAFYPLMGSGAQAGRTIGRPPGALTPNHPSDWAVYSVADATPAAENPLPRVEQLIPMDGEITQEAVVPLDWYATAGAGAYRVQVTMEPDEAFAAPLLDVTTKEAQVDTPSLNSSKYLWRVQSIDASGRAGRFSDVGRFEVVRPLEPAPALENGLALRIRQQRVPPVSTNAHILSVPLIRSHKDTTMLQLENKKERDPHGWDVDHRVYSHSDPSDNNNCVPASVVMVSRFLGGNLSQDRIGYEALSREAEKYLNRITSAPRMSGFEGRRTPGDIRSMLREPQQGPGWDMPYGRGTGLNPAQVLVAMTYAFGSAPRLDILETPDEIWRWVVAEIDQRRPMLMAAKAHMFVVKGYEVVRGQRLLVLNNPARSGEWRRSIDSARLDPRQVIFYFLPPVPTVRRQSPDVTIDGDGDGVVDFDETQRFFTDPLEIDTDKDGVLDKQDIAAGVFDSMYGYSLHPTPHSLGRDFDQDGVATELDPDSDAGGCLDGVEDANRDGHALHPETWNFRPDDDVCRQVGGHITAISTMQRIGQMSIYNSHSFHVTVALKPATPGRIGPLVDNGSRFQLHTVAQLTIDIGPGCQIYSRVSAHGGGTFVGPAAEVGGSVSDNELVVGAHADAPGSFTTDLCFTSGTQSEARGGALPECTGQRVGQTNRFTFNCLKPATAPPPEYEVLRWSVTGSVSLDPPSPPPDLMTQFIRRAYYGQERLGHRPTTVALAGGGVHLRFDPR